MGSFFNNKKLALTTISPSGTGGLRWFSRTSSTDEAGACYAVINKTCRIDTTGNTSQLIPETGNIVYNYLSGTIVFDGNNLYYLFVPYYIDDNNTAYLCQVQDATGVIMSVLPITCV